MAPHIPDSSTGSRRSARLSAQAGLAPSSVHAGARPNSGSGIKTRRGGPPDSKEKVNLGQKRARYAGQADQCADPHVAKRSISKRDTLTKMPIEILVEIAKYMHPLNLLLLSRTNKYFRSLFMDRRTAKVWRSAQSTVPDLPPCPGERLSEPQYVVLLFTKTCSLCGGSTSRPADPTLLVRLCARCCAEETMEVLEAKHPALVIRSYDLVPGKESEGRCMYYESLLVQGEFDKLAATGDREKTADWLMARKILVNQRQNEAEPLRGWIRQREQERENKLEQLKSNHEKEVKARLLGLGWDAVDFKTYGIKGERSWNRLVRVAKPLRESAWTKMLPKLLEQLDKNRENRLALEKEIRRTRRIVELRQWVEVYCGQQAPLFQATAKRESAVPDSSGCGYSELVAYSAIYVPEPGIEEEWPGIQEVLDRDLPTDAFIQEAKARETELCEILRNRASALEARLTQMLPQDIQPAQFGNGLGEAPVFTYTTGTGDSVDTLPESTRKLLRADVLFSTDIMTSRLDLLSYPEDFSSLFGHTNGLFYDREASNVAKVLLNALGWPNASSLELKALKPTFVCGRCDPGDIHYDWPALVRHYVLGARRWKGYVDSFYYLTSPGFRHLFTHDLGVVDCDRPLVQLSHGALHPHGVAHTFGEGRSD